MKCLWVVGTEHKASQLNQPRLDLFNYAQNPLKYFDCIQALLKNLIYSIESTIII